MKSKKRTLIIGVIWGVLFFLWWLNGFLYENWRFDFLSYKSWSYLMNEFMSGWTISSASDWIFLLTLFVALPVFLYGWQLLLKVQWKNVLQSIQKVILTHWYKASAPKKVLKVAAKKSHKAVRPRPLNRIARADDNRAPVTATTSEKEMVGDKTTFSREAERSVGKSIAGFSMDEPEFMKSTAPVTEQLPIAEPRVLEDDLSDENFEQLIQIPAPEPLNEDPVSLLIGKGYKVVKEATVGGVAVDYVGIGTEKILVVLLDKQKGDWLADEERFNGEDPLWFSESSHRVSPIYQLVVAAAFLAQKMARKGYLQQVVPVFAVNDGVIINAEDMEDTWRELGVLVCRTHVGGPETLKSLTDTLPNSSGSVDTGDINVIRELF